MTNYDKFKIRDALVEDNIFELLNEWGGDPVKQNGAIVSATICHNQPGEGSHKLYYYINTKLFKCYTGCEESVFDIFELYRKTQKIQHNKECDLNEAVRWIAQRFHLDGDEVSLEENQLEDWEYIANYERIQSIELKTNNVVLKEYDKSILKNFNYTVQITPWMKEGITQEALYRAGIGYYPGKDQIIIPHYDQDNRFIGLRGRTLVEEDAEAYGKYRPVMVNNLLYNHPLGFNLYGLNWSRKNINVITKAIVFESEKSVLKYASAFGWSNNISVAVCGSNLTDYQFNLLKQNNVRELIIAFDKQYEQLNTQESKQWIKKLTKINTKYKSEMLISFLWDKEDKLGYKDSPIDCGKDTFLYLYNKRIII